MTGLTTIRTTFARIISFVPSATSVWLSLLCVCAGLFTTSALPNALLWPMRVLFAGAALWLTFAAVRMAMTAKLDGKKIVFTGILGLFLYGMFFLMCHVFLKLMSAKDESVMSAKTDALTDAARLGIRAMLDGASPVQYDAEIGWVHRPGYEWRGHSITAQGLRGTKLYPETAADPSKRILCIGDSFTFGYEVPDAECYPAHGEGLLPGMEWINLGLCGAGLTQMLEQYRKNGRKFGGKYVVIGFMTNNKKRTVNSYRAFLAPTSSMTPMTMPFAKMTNGVHSIEPNPYQSLADYERLLENEPEELAKLRELDYITWSNLHGSTNPIARTFRYVFEAYGVRRNLDVLLQRREDARPPRPGPGEEPYGDSIWHPASLAFQANTGVFDLLHKEILADGRIPLFVILPSAQDVKERSKGLTPLHKELLAYLREKEYPHFDFLDSLERKHGRKLREEDLYVGTHFNGVTNKLLAKEIIKALRLP
ncbi:MAG: SGNH/GDSL hydrolase family protein [Roseimicrobium sp.]